MTTAYGFIYITTNTVNGMRYVGQRAYRDGWERYIGSGKILLRAIKLYGRAAFIREIVEETECKASLDAAEIAWIARLNAVNDPSFYNLNGGGHTATNGFAGKRHTPETRDLMRQRALGHPVTQKIRDAARQNIKAAHHTKRDYPRDGAHPRARRIVFEDVTYPTIAAAMRATGLPRSVILRGHRGAFVRAPYVHPRARKVSYRGQVFESITALGKHLGMSVDAVRQMIGRKHQRDSTIFFTT